MDQTSTGATVTNHPADLLVDPSYAELVLAADLTVAAASDSYLRILGKRREEVVGRPLREVVAEGPDLERLVDSLTLVLRTRRPHRAALDSIDGRGSASSHVRSY